MKPAPPVINMVLLLIIICYLIGLRCRLYLLWLVTHKAVKPSLLCRLYRHLEIILDYPNCISFYSYKDVEKLEKFLQGKAVSEQEIGRQLLNDIVSFSETSVCRRKFILHYFGEDYDVKACDEKCDNCANPKEKFEGKELVQKLLKTVLALNQKHKSNHIADVVAGQLNNEITNYKHNHLEVFGIGKDRDTNSWNSIIRQAVLQEFIRKEVESYGIIKVTQKGQDFLKNPKSVSFFKERDYSDLSGPIIQDSKNTVVDENLFVLLKELTKQVSKEKQIPPFVLCSLLPPCVCVCVQLLVCLYV
jgi:ATP-dependent DNA helicase RecQ